MTDAGLISERLRKKSLEKKAAEQHKREEMLREYNRRLRENEKSPFFLSEVQKKEVREYWESHTNFRKSQNTESDTQLNVEGWVEYYSGLYGMYDRRFLPDPVYYLDIDSYYNHRAAAKYIDNKCFYSRLFPQIRQPEIIAEKVNGFWLDKDFRGIQMEEILRKCREAGKIIVKPAVDFGGGAGIFIWDAKKDATGRLEKYLLRTVIDTVIMVFLEQHREMKKLHPSSVNTVRTISFYYKNEIRILSSVVRMGTGDSEVDNISAGGISAGIKEDGRLKNVGFNKSGKRFLTHPDGAVFGECRVPCYEQICSHIREAHKFFPYFRLISWDFAVDCEGNPVLIEANLRNGELDFHQINNGPLFRELTDEVLWEVYRKSCKFGSELPNLPLLTQQVRQERGKDAEKY
ncbi:sugar-transfer associated ATP-grasp domain-containing protein [Blautia sp. HCP3S3_G3]|uniref:sugar-transfer associated ATP-grasp domain-containing protein n=1 Tax=Blautia sp. HCP3S3_G3 TaxID=3438913 RepID=UPI003F8C2329